MLVERHLRLPIAGVLECDQHAKVKRPIGLTLALSSSSASNGPRPTGLAGRWRLDPDHGVIGGSGASPRGVLGGTARYFSSLDLNSASASPSSQRVEKFLDHPIEVLALLEKRTVAAVRESLEPRAADGLVHVRRT